MKRLVRKNQVLITALVAMIAIAGYLNYSGRVLEEQEDIETALDISMDETPGDSVLTSGNVSGIIADAKLTRDSARATNRESLMGIINSSNLTNEQKETAVSQMVEMTRLAELEATVETMLISKGFTEAIVSISEGSVDVVIHSEELTDANRAQIEDIITRKTDVSPENIVITPVYE